MNKKLKPGESITIEVDGGSPAIEVDSGSPVGLNRLYFEEALAFVRDGYKAQRGICTWSGDICVSFHNTHFELTLLASPKVRLLSFWVPTPGDLATPDWEIVA